MLTEEQMLQINKDGWNKVAPQFFEGSFDELGYGLYTPTDEKLGLFGEVQNQVVLEVGSGSGHTLEFFAKNGARELWGVDLSIEQIETAKKVVSRFSSTPINFINAPMENIPNLPNDYFDKAISIYALGWTVDLKKTLSHIHKSLKPNGIFVFSWEHPIHTLLAYEEEKGFVTKGSYLDEGPTTKESWRGVPIVKHKRKVSTYVNALIESGFVIDRIVEEVEIPENDTTLPTNWYSAERAKIVPDTLVIKCHKE